MVLILFQIDGMLIKNETMKRYNMEDKILSRKQFEILSYLENTSFKKTQREISADMGMSLSTVNRVVASLNEKHFLNNLELTDEGYDALEPYRVKRAVFIAAGFGSRMVPITLNTPKPLVRVKGTRIIDTLIDAVLAAGIEEIYIVRGYLGEQFDQLLYKYPNIKFIDNLIYNESNNISSAMCMRSLLEGAYVIEGDLVLYNPKLITKYQYTSNYLGVKVDKTDDWCFETKNRSITKMKIGGLDCYCMVGISYWNSEDGRKLKEDIEKVFNMPGGKESYWDQVALDFFIKDYNIEVRECRREDIIEIDTFNELKQVDSAYR
jgi:CTP:phosphocholine cytidylyltransferase-like protein